MSSAEIPPQAGALVSNGGEPIKLADVNIHGVAAKACREGDQAEIWTRLAITSDEQNFHRIADNLCAAIEHAAQQSGEYPTIKRADTVLLVMKPDNSAELWVDTAARAIHAMMKRDMVAGSVVFEADIGDITGMDFPLVEFGAGDRVICIFRQDWRFGMYFDFNPDGQFDRAQMAKSLGRLLRYLRYRHLYDALADQAAFEQLIAHGWFPFVEIIGEFSKLTSALESGFELHDTEVALCGTFDRERFDRMLLRWSAKPHFQCREVLLRQAADAYFAGLYAPAIKTVLTEIEGILTDAYRQAHGKPAGLKAVLDYAIESAEARAGGADTLLFSSAFAHYLKSSTFMNFDPRGPKGNAGSRHAVGHGAADAASYTRARALQAFLTLDQLAFYT